METKKFAIKNILIPYDFSETAALALEHAVFMAKLCKAQISLLHVIETYSFTSAISHAFSKSQSEFENKIEESTKLNWAKGSPLRICKPLLRYGSEGRKVWIRSWLFSGMENSMKKSIGYVKYNIAKTYRKYLF